MSRKYGDPKNAASDNDRFDQMPRWIWRSDKFKKLKGPEAMLLIYLVGRQDWLTHCVPAVMPSELAEAVGYNRNRMSEAVQNLTILGIIALEREKWVFKIQILYKDPDVVNLRTKTEITTSPLSAEVKKLSLPSKDRKEKLRYAQENVAEIARKDSGDFLPDWVREDSGHGIAAYEPGADIIPMEATA